MDEVINTNGWEVRYFPINPSHLIHMEWGGIIASNHTSYPTKKLTSLKMLEMIPSKGFFGFIFGDWFDKGIPLHCEGLVIIAMHEWDESTTIYICC